MLNNLEITTPKTISTMTDPEVGNNHWYLDMESILEKIRKNSVILSHHHKKYYIYLKERLKYFRIPVIVLSSINTVLSISLDKYTQYASIVICGINLIVTIISSIELFLNIQKQIENNLILQSGFYTLSINIYKILKLNRTNRTVKGIDFLNESFDEYNRLFHLSTLQSIKDSLTPLEKELEDAESPNSSTIHNETNI
jgi:hypothetical protein